MRFLRLVPLLALSGCTITIPQLPSPGPSCLAADICAPLPGPKRSPGPQPSPVPHETSTPAPSPLPTPTGQPSVVPSPTPRPSSTPFQQWTPAPTATPTAFRTVILDGQIRDETGASVDGAIITVTSLNPGTPYVATSTSVEGAWVMNNVPYGSNVEIKVTKDGWTTRRRVGSFQEPSRNHVDFGAADPSQDPGAAYFISRYPEVSRVEHQGDSAIFTLSEPLDGANQRRFEDNIRVRRAKDAQAPLLGARVTQGAAIRWDATGLVATLELPAGTLGSGSFEAVLLAGTARVVDKDNWPLGLVGGDWQGTAQPTDLVQAVFRNPELALPLDATTGAKRWTATHLDAAPI